MKTAYVDLIKTGIRHGLSVSVWDGEEWQVKKSRDMRVIVDAVKSVEEARLQFWDDEGDGTWVRVGFADVSAYGLEPEETVMDFSDRPWMNAWSESFHHWNDI